MEAKFSHNVDVSRERLLKAADPPIRQVTNLEALCRVLKSDYIIEKPIF